MFQATIKHTDPETVAFAMHKGPYESVGPAYDALTQWITENGYEIRFPVRTVQH
jgi:effector-binding domain-containing protein